MAKTLREIISELEQLEAQVNPGPWHWASDFEIGNCWHWYIQCANRPGAAVCLGLVSIANRDWSLDRYPTDEMRYLTAARNAVPALVAEIKRLRAMVAEKRQEVNR